MPRGPRFAFENAFYHVFNRGINKQPIFLKDSDYIFFLKKLQDLKNKQFILDGLGSDFRQIEDLFEKEEAVLGTPKFGALAQKKYLRRKTKNYA